VKLPWRQLGIGLLGAILFLATWIALALLLHAAHLPLRMGDVVLAIAGFATYIAYVRRVERRGVTELQTRTALPEVAGGFAFGLALFGVVIAALALSGHYHVTAFGNPTALATGLVIWLSGAVMEELLFRGFIFRTIRNLAGTWIAVAVSALLFGLLHAANPGSTVFSSFAIALEAGVLLALAYAVTNRLWLPIGIHAGWNYAEGTIFGTAVSGATVKSTLLHGALSGNSLLTGGAFGV
jgi:membrane protease YdiL (CAAX protease family)